MAANLLTKMRLLKSPKREMTILDGVSGVLLPRRLTLLLGPPSGGKTTLLKALAGKLRGVQVSPSRRLQPALKICHLVRRVRCCIHRKCSCQTLSNMLASRVSGDEAAADRAGWAGLAELLGAQETGSVTYNGEDLHSGNFVPARTSSYVEQAGRRPPCCASYSAAAVDVHNINTIA